MTTTVIVVAAVVVIVVVIILRRVVANNTSKKVHNIDPFLIVKELVTAAECLIYTIIEPVIITVIVVIGRIE